MAGRLRRVVAAVQPRPRLVDWSLLVAVAFLLATGLVSLVTGRSSGGWIFWAHGVAGLCLVALLGFKLRRVRRRLTNRRLWTPATAVSAATTLVALAALGTGVFWVLGGNLRVAYWGALNVHVLFGLLVVPLTLIHLWTRRGLPTFRRPRDVDFEGRRTALQYGGLLVAGAVLWRAQQTANRLLGTAGAARRFTGSKPVADDGSGAISGGDEWDADSDDDVGSAAGGPFPVTSWVADDPDPIARETWSLRVDGAVDDAFEVGYDELLGGVLGEGAADGDATDSTTPHERRALLDCTSGWYTVQNWRGVRVGDLLDRAGVADDARYVRFVSVTGYRWSLPLAEARDVLLATHVGGDPLTHGHGAPLRLVAPGRRGFQWVKWVERVDVRTRSDPAQWVVTLVSGLDD